MIKISTIELVEFVRSEYDRELESSKKNEPFKSGIYKFCKEITVNEKDVETVYEMALQLRDSYKKELAEEEDFIAYWN